MCTPRECVWAWANNKRMDNSLGREVHCTGTATRTQTLTDINSGLLHDVLVFDVHGPDMAVEKARWIRPRVVP